MTTYTIGQAANAAEITTRAARLYEARGLVEPAERTSAGYRVFTDENVEAFAFVRRARALGLSLDGIAEISAITQSGAPCDRTRALLAERLTGTVTSDSPVMKVLLPVVGATCPTTV
ncbi:MAG: MerR family transcriptional regulator [Acidimicrobiales bacterium]